MTLFTTDNTSHIFPTVHDGRNGSPSVVHKLTEYGDTGAHGRTATKQRSTKKKKNALLKMGSPTHRRLVRGRRDSRETSRRVGTVQDHQSTLTVCINVGKKSWHFYIYINEFFATTDKHVREVIKSYKDANGFLFLFINTKFMFSFFTNNVTMSDALCPRNRISIAQTTK